MRVSLLAALSVLLVATAARADATPESRAAAPDDEREASSRLEEPPPEPQPPGPRTHWEPNKPLLITGAMLLGAGYLPNVAVAAPSAVGIFGRAFALAFFGWVGCALKGDTSSYICAGEHGAIQLLIPVAGPFLFAGGHPRDSIVNKSGQPLSATARALLYTSGGLQFAGAVALLSSLALGEQVRPSGSTGSATTGARGPSFFVAPLGVPGSVGLEAGVHRW
jgi:hypothetical protein